MSLDPHFKKTVLALHFDSIEDAAANSLWVGLRSDVVSKWCKSFGTATWKSAGVTDASLEGRACLRIAATSDYYGLYNTGVTLLFDTVFTFEMVFYATSTPSALCGSINGAATSYVNFSLTVSSGTLRVTTRGTTYDTGVAVPLNQWNHLAACSDGVAVEVFLNGVKLGRYARGGDSSAHNGVRVGVNGYSSTGFVGYVSDFRAYKGVRKYVANFIPAWPLPQFSVHNDAAPSTRQVTTAGSTLSVYTADSKFGGGCLYLDGASYAECPASADWNFGTGDFTVEAWVKRSAGGVWQAIVGQWNNTTDKSWSMHIGPSNDLAFFTKDATFDHYTGTGGSAQLPAGEWVHCAASRQGDTLRLFLNGELKATNTSFAGYAVGVSGTVLRIGRAVAVTDPFTGYIDDVRITKGVARYTENFTPPAQAFPDGQAVVSGVIYDSEGNLCSRRVFVHSRNTGRLLGTAMSDPVTGTYEIAAEEECYVVCLDSTGNYNAKIIDGVDPTT